MVVVVKNKIIATAYGDIDVIEDGHESPVGMWKVEDFVIAMHFIVVDERRTTTILKRDEMNMGRWKP